MCHGFFVFRGLRQEVVVQFVDHHCLNFLLMKKNTVKNIYDLPALVWDNLAMQSQANAIVSLDVESCSKSTKSLIPAADDKACSSSGIILASTTT